MEFLELVSFQFFGNDWDYAIWAIIVIAAILFIRSILEVVCAICVVAFSFAVLGFATLCLLIGFADKKIRGIAK